MSLKANALINIKDLKAYIGLQTAKYDSLLTMIINVVTDSIENYTKRRFVETIYTNLLLNGTGNVLMPLYALPINSSYGITLQHYNGSSWDTISSDSYMVGYAEGLITLVDGQIFLKGLNNYRITYKGGYSDPNDYSDIRFAAFVLSKKAFDKRKQVKGIRSQSLKDYSIEFMNDAFIDTEIKSILDLYRI